MASRSSIEVAAVLALSLAAGRGWAQEKTSCAATTTLRVQVVIARFQNEKKQASLPYAFVVPARPDPHCSERRVHMRMGVETPVPVTTGFAASESGSPKPATSFQYKSVGTNIDCSATELGEGRYQLNLVVENSSALAGPEGGATTVAFPGVPIFRTFNTSLDPILRDGQTLQAIASTDPVTGEVVKIDVTMNIVK